MSVAHRIELPYRVRFDECGADGLLRSSGYLRYAQEVAWVHSEAAGFDRHWYGARSLTWLVRCAVLEMREPVEHGTTLTVSTQVAGWRRVWARRRSEFAVEGRVVAEARIDWVLLGPSGAPVRVPAELAALFTERSVERYEPARVELGPTPADAWTGTVAVRRQDLDPMAHVSNATYVDYAEDALDRAGGAAVLARPARTYSVEYLRSAEADQRLVGASWPLGDGWAYRLSDPSGHELFGALLSAPLSKIES